MKTKPTRFSDDFFIYYDDEGMYFTQESYPRKPVGQLGRERAAYLAQNIVHYLLTRDYGTFSMGGMQATFKGGLRLKVGGMEPQGDRYLTRLPPKDLPGLLTVIGKYLLTRSEAK